MWMALHPGVAGAVAAVCLFSAPPQQATQAPGIERLVERIEARYENASIRAHFVQNRLDRLGSVVSSREGEVYIETPGRMRWEYDNDNLLMVAGGTGREAYLYFPADNEVHVLETEAADPSQMPLFYLSGRGDLSRDFNVQVVEWGTPLSRNNVQLELRPRRGETSFERLIIEVEPLQATIARLISFDNLRNTVEYQFRDVAYDAELSDELFEFEIPDGAQVVFIGG